MTLGIKTTVLCCSVWLLFLGTSAQAQAPAGNRVVARWQGTMEETGDFGFKPMTDLFGYLITGPGKKVSMRATVAFREELTPRGIRVFVPESLAWSAEEKDLFYLHRDDGSRVGAGPGGQGGGSYSEAQLAGPEIPRDDKEIARARQRLDEAQRALKTAQAQREAAAKARDAADKARNLAKGSKDIEALKKAFEDAQVAYEQAFDNEQSTDEMRRAATAALTEARNAYLNAVTAAANVTSDLAKKELAFAKAQASLAEKDDAWRSATHVVEDAQAEFDRVSEVRRRPLASIAVTYADAKVQTGRVSVGFDLNLDPEFTIQYLPMKQVQGDGAGRTALARIGKRITIVLDDAKTVHRRVAIPPIPSGAAVGTLEKGRVEAVFESPKGANPRVKIRFERRGATDDDKTLAIKGKIYHRLRVPQDDKDSSVILSPIVGDALPAGTLPVQGPVRVEAWILDGSADEQKSPPHYVVDSQGDPNQFELRLPEPPRGKTLRLAFNYHSTDAKLLERNVIETSTDSLLKAQLGKGPGLVDLQRRSHAWVRYEKKPFNKKMDLGSETRAGKKETQGNTLVLSLDGPQAVLINSFMLKGNYLNQNLNAFTIQEVEVPARRLVQIIPSFYWPDSRDARYLEWQVRKRLGVPDTGEVPETVKTTVTVRGSVICFPTTTTMALGVIGANGLTEEVISDKIGAVAQAVYDRYLEKGKQRLKGAFPFRFPFDEGARAKALRDVSTVQYHLQGHADLGSISSAEGVAIRNSMFRYWPFADPDASQINKQWLISVPAANDTWLKALDHGFRPWQFADLKEPYLRGGVEAAFSSVETQYTNNVNLFAANYRDALRELSKGSSALLRIEHKEDGGDRGGHAFCMVGAIIDNSGGLARMIVHDPYGDQTKNPTHEGYYGGVLSDVDRAGSDGKYAPYGSEIRSYGKSLYTTSWVVFRNRDATMNGARLVRSSPFSGPAPD